MNLLLIFKILLIVIFAIFIRGIVPRYRIDQFTQLNWKTIIFYFFLFFIVVIPIILIYS